MAVSDRLAILQGGRVQQIGQPDEIYYAPGNRFVAEFMGSCNVVEVAVNGYDSDRGLVRGTLYGRPVIFHAAAPPTAPVVTVLIRPEWTRIAEEGPDGAANTIPGRVVTRTFLGSVVSYEVEVAEGQRFRLEVPDPRRSDLRKEGERLRFRFDPDRPVVLTP